MQACWALRSGLLVLLLAGPAGAASAGTHATVSANPIRRVVTMLQMLQKKVIAEGEKEKDLYEKYMCWCKTGGETLKKSIADAEAKIPEVLADLKEAEAEKTRLEAEVIQHKKDREDAKAAMAEATAIREKEAKAFAEENAEFLANIAAIEKAVAALEKGMGLASAKAASLPTGLGKLSEHDTLYAKATLKEEGAAGFLQTSAAAVLRRIVLSSDSSLSNADRDLLTSFLAEGTSTGEGYAPQSGEIVGILKQMADRMAKDKAEAIAAEEEAIKVYEALMEAKTKEVEAATKAIEDKLVRIGELGVEIVNIKEDVEDTVESLEEDKKFLADLAKNCAAKQKDWEFRSKMRSDEIVAIADTIKILNDDDALELFKKTLPSPSLLQELTTSKDVRARALQALERRHRAGDPRLDLIALAIRGKKVSFEKVIKMIDDMVVLLAKEQAADEEKKAYCETEIDKTEDDLKELDYAIKTLGTNIEDAKTAIATLTEEIAALIAGIKDLDKQVAEATAQRKEEHEDYIEELAANNAAKDVITFAKNRMNKFYNPKMYKPAPKRELSAEERITVNMGGTLAPTQPPAGIAGTGIGLLEGSVAPPPPPETYGAYAKKSEEGNGVISMMDLLIKDLAKEITEMETEEKLAQEDYVEFMAESAAKRAADTKSLGEKEAAKAGLEADLVKMVEEEKEKKAEAMATMDTLKDLHLECDWLLKNFELRKEARAGEVEALKAAKAVLSGADYSLVQIGALARRRISLRTGL